MKCPDCHVDTQYQSMSGGREWYCPGCGNTGTYPADMDGGPRARLLAQGPEGVAELRRQMREELARHQQEPS